MDDNILDCIQWLTDNEIHAYEDDGSVFVTVSGEDVQITTAEIDYRAELYREGLK